MAGLAAIHPTEHNEHDSVAALAPVAGDWVGLHLLLLPTAALLGAGLYSLVADSRGPVALVATVAAAVYAFGATVIDAVNGLAVGLFLQGVTAEPGLDPATVEPALHSVFGGPVVALTGLVTIIAYVVAVLSVAVVLSRDGAPLPALAALVGSTAGVVSHVGTTGVVGYCLFFVGAAWLEFRWEGADLAASGEVTVGD